MEHLEEEQTETSTKKPNLLLMITNPAENFKRIRNNPTWITALITVLLLTMVTSVSVIFLSFSAMNVDNTYQELFEIEQPAIRELLTAGIIFAIITVAISVPFMNLLQSLIFFIVGKITKSTATFKQYFSLNIHISIIGVLGSILMLVYNMTTRSVELDFIFTSIQSIVQAEGVLGIILLSIEVFAIWQLIITAIGLQIVARIPKGTAWTTVIILYLITLGFAIGSYYINQWATTFTM